MHTGPRAYVKDGKIVLNVSMSATAQLKLGSDEVSFSGRFGGASMHVRVPIAAVLAIYARETGQGLVFSDEDGAPTPGSPEPSPPDATPPEPARRARLTVVK